MCLPTYLPTYQLVENSAKLLIPLLEMRARMQYTKGVRKIPSSPAAAGLKKLGTLISDARTLSRLWGTYRATVVTRIMDNTLAGLLPIFQWLISIERTPPPTRRLLTLERLQGLSMLVYYPLEHLSYLGSQGVISLPKGRISQYSLWSCRAWAFYVCLQFLHLKEDWALLKRRERALKKDLAAGAEEEKRLVVEIQIRKEAILNELVVNLGYLPLTVHWCVSVHLSLLVLIGSQVAQRWPLQK